MNYKFDVNLTDKDYLDFNIFWMIKSPYSKKQMTKLRLALIALFVSGGITVMLLGDNSVHTYMSVGGLAIILLLFQIFIASFMAWSLKCQLKSMKKNGKMAFTSKATLEFSDDVFIETTPDSKTEQKYTSVERISIISGNIIYIHINNIMAYLLPMSSFSSAEEFKKFIDFMKTKVADIDTY